jgi:retinol dehydrogenase 12
MNHSETLHGRTVLVTGGTSGIGYYTAKALADLGAQVYLTGRDAGRGQEAEGSIREAAGHDHIHFVQADASTVGGNQALAQHLLAEVDQLHILVNNVGGLYNDRWETRDGYEATLAMNLIGSFALTAALLPALRAAAPARVINVASAGYSMWKGDLYADIHARDSYNGSMAYARSKTMNILWTLALARRLEGSEIAANAIHPGTAWTAMNQSSEARLFPPGMRPFWPILRLVQRTGSPEKAARTSIYLASALEAAGMTGKYYESSTRPRQLPPEMLDLGNQERTWELAEELVAMAPTAILETVITAG